MGLSYELLQGKRDKYKLKSFSTDLRKLFLTTMDVVYTCSHCVFATVVGDQLDNHIRQHHRAPDQNNPNLFHHLLPDTQERLEETASNLNGNILQGNQENCYVCNQCDYRTKHSNLWYTHNKEHQLSIEKNG